MNNSLKIKKLVGVAVLAALVAILQSLSLVLKFGPFSATLALIPIVMGAILYGPKAGLVLGFTMGCFTLLDAAAFLAVDPVATVFVCLLKASMAGFISGLMFRLVGKFNFTLGIICAALIAPIVNTGIFVIGCYLFFFETIKSWAGSADTSVTRFLFLSMLGLNFLLEFALNSVLSPVFTYVTRVLTKNYDLGFNKVLKDGE